MQRREFLQVLAAGAAAGFTLDAPRLLAAEADEKLYDLPRFGNVHVLHFTDCHAQLLPLNYREPDTNLGIGTAAGHPPHLVGEPLLKAFHIRPHGVQAHAFTSLDFVAAAQTYGKVGGFAHLATLIQRLRATRPGALLLDGGDTWQGSATALWTRGQDMIDACKQLGVDAMAPHWEFTYGAARVKEVLERDLKGHIDFLAQNVATADFDDPVFAPYSLREQNGVPVAVIGQAFPYVPIAHPPRFTPEWTFGIQEAHLQQTIDEVRAQGARIVLLLSHNGMDVDLKLAGRVRGLDAILGGHTHDAVPAPTIVSHAGGQTLVINSGSHGKFLSVLDLDVREGRLRDFRYRLLPLFSNLLPADPAMAAYIDTVRAPFKERLGEQLAVSEGLLYRRGNFNGSWDQLILDALLEVQGAQIAFSPGFRWGGTLLPGEAISVEQLMAQTAITYPQTTLTNLTGAAIKNLLEDVCDNLFNPDPYKQQGGDMVRVGGLAYACAPGAAMGQRIRDLHLVDRRGTTPLEADKTYRVAGWAPVAGGEGKPVWDIVAAWLRDRKTVTPRRLNLPKLIGVTGNPGLL